MRYLTFIGLIVLIGCSVESYYDEPYELYYARDDSPHLRVKVATFDMTGDVSSLLNGKNCWKMAKFLEDETDEVSPGTYRYWCEAKPKP
jgi:hypothetical protein